jgi:hypothetical protein
MSLDTRFGSANATSNLTDNRSPKLTDNRSPKASRK